MEWRAVVLGTTGTTYKCYQAIEMPTGRPGGVAGYPRACYYRSISWVRVPPSAYSYKFVGAFSCAQIDSRKARKRELATFDESRRAVEMLSPMRDNSWRNVPGGRRDDTWVHSLFRSWKGTVRPKKKKKMHWQREKRKGQRNKWKKKTKKN